MRRFQEATHASIVDTAIDVILCWDEERSVHTVELESFRFAGLRQFMLCVFVEVVLAYLFFQSAPTSKPKPNNPLKNVVKTERPPDLNFSFETSTEVLVDGRMSASVGLHSVSRR